ncbi:hypothetical protein ACE017_08245 [Shewanella mangrovisoli]
MKALSKYRFRAIHAVSGLQQLSRDFTAVPPLSRNCDKMAAVFC